MSQYDSDNQQPQQPQPPLEPQPPVGQPQYGQPQPPQQPYGSAPTPQWGAAPQPPVAPPKKTNVTLIVAIILGVVVVALVAWIIIGQVNKLEPPVTPPAQTSEATTPSVPPTPSATPSQTPSVTPSPTQENTGGASAPTGDVIALPNGGAGATDPETGHTFTVLEWVEEIPLSPETIEAGNYVNTTSHIAVVHIKGTGGTIFRDRLNSSTFRMTCETEGSSPSEATDSINGERADMEAAGYAPWPKDPEVGQSIDAWIAFRVRVPDPGSCSVSYVRNAFQVLGDDETIYPTYKWSVELPNS